MKLKSILIISILTISLSVKSQDKKHPTYAEITEPITPERLAEYRTELLTYLETLPSWKKLTNLDDKIEFNVDDIQIYGWYDYPIHQIDFRLTFPSDRKKGFLYKAQYYYVSQPIFCKNEVTIYPGSTEYIKIKK